MRKFLYILLGIVLLGGALTTFGVRQLGWEVPGLSQYDDHGPSARSVARERGWHRHDGGSRGGGLSFATVLDLLNFVVGVIGIVLTVIGMRMQRNAMHMSMRGRD